MIADEDGGYGSAIVILTTSVVSGTYSAERFQFGRR
jgi:hypothetical protein